MSPLSSFALHAVDLLSGLGPVKARAMFGGYGLSLDGRSIGLIAADRLYLRVDDLTRAEFEAAGSGPFVYSSKNGPMTMRSYVSIPEEAVDDPERAERWGKLAVEAARRADAKRKRRAGPSAKARSGAGARGPRKRAR